MEDNHKILEKEIDLIQSIIDRISTKSFLLKGWFLSIFAITCSINTKFNVIFADKGKLIILPTICILFWYLDAFFLQKEKRYRKMYDWVIKNRLGSNDFIYDLNHKRFSSETKSNLLTMFNITLIMFYGIPLVLFCILILITSI